MSHEINGELVPVGGGDPIPLIREKLVVGRRDSCDIPMHFPSISGQHCELTYRNGYWYIKDLNSTNGVKVNGTRVHEKLLHPSDKITIAKRVYTIVYELPAGRVAQEEVEEDIMSRSLLQKAGLERPEKTDSKGRRMMNPNELHGLNEEEDD
jgi:pSer/pThr/pTyr-binding forkhead associated (FHA) protein